MQQLLISLCWRNQSISVLLFASNTRLLPRGLRWLCLWVDEFWGAASKSFWLYFVKIWFTASKNFWRHQFSCLVIGQYRTTFSLLIHRQIASSCAWRTRHIVIAVYICFSGPEVVIFAYWWYTLIGILPCGLVIRASNDTRQMCFLWLTFTMFFLSRGPRTQRAEYFRSEPYSLQKYTRLLRSELDTKSYTLKTIHGKYDLASIQEILKRPRPDVDTFSACAGVSARILHFRATASRPWSALRFSLSYVFQRFLLVIIL